MIRAKSMLRRSALLMGALAMAGCGSFWPWSDSRPKLPDPPAASASLPARIAWTVKLPAGGVGFAPVVANGALFAAAADGTVVRIDPATGRTVWQVNAGKRLVVGPGSDGEVVVVASRDGTLIALDSAGKPRWSVPLGAEAVSVPSVGLGLAIVRTADNRISAFETDTGKRRWIVSRQLPPLVLRQTSSIAIAPGTAYAGLPGGRLVAIGLQNGVLRWEAAVSNPRGANEIERIADVIGSPLVSGREICAGSYQGKVACFDAPTGRAIWARDVATAGGIDIDARLVSVSDDKGHVQAYSRTGTSVWRQEKLARRDPSAPLSVGPALVVGDVQGFVYLLSRDDGAIAARFASDGTPVVSPAAAHERTAIVQTSGGTLLAVAID
ncbi:MAG: outer membrane protein assembly factor BamB [Burkholderiaceae bacterium]|nr:outer membrane protein assembly factor BamB [Burkholderiaceae bacterium]